MSIRKAIKRAVDLYESFREAKPRRIGRVEMTVPSVVACMGYVEGIDYRTTHGKKTTLYHHDFAPGSRPLLCVSADGQQLLLLGGRYHFTERGIVDKDARGREIDNPAHGRNMNPKRESRSEYDANRQLKETDNRKPAPDDYFEYQRKRNPAEGWKSHKVGKWEVFILPAEKRGYFEHDDLGEGGGLWFEGRDLSDFDGQAELPADVIKGIRALKYRVSADFT